MKQFYTYLHCKPDGTPFYVGKGYGYRAFQFKRRNPFHNRIIEKYSVENIQVYIFYCENEDEALKDEIHQISQLRSQGYKLCNLTAGGEGSSGLHPSSETIQKMSLAHRGNKHGLGYRHDELSKIKIAESSKMMWLAGSA